MKTHTGLSPSSAITEITSNLKFISGFDPVLVCDFWTKTLKAAINIYQILMLKEKLYSLIQ